MSKLVRFPWETRAADLVGVESLTERLDVAVEARFREDLIQVRVERMRGAWQILCRDPRRGLPGTVWVAPLMPSAMGAKPKILAC